MRVIFKGHDFGWMSDSEAVALVAVLNRSAGWKRRTAPKCVPYVVGKSPVPESLRGGAV